MKRLGMWLQLMIAASMCCRYLSGATLIVTVSDGAGPPLSGAQVKLTPAHPVGRGSQHLDAVSVIPSSAITSALGEAEFDNVAPGTYSMCVIPNNRTHINSCAAPRSGNPSVSVTAAEALVRSNLTAVSGVPISLTVVASGTTAKQPTSVFLDSADGRFFPMESDNQPGHFWAVVPAATTYRVVTAMAGGPVGLPSEVVSAGPVGVPVDIGVLR